ncbi:MAG: IPT/TIG domain-containing protein [Pseudonocardiales bacterium]
MKIDSIITNPAPPGQPVIIKGDGLDAAKQLLFGNEPVPFKVNSTGGIETNVPDGSGTVDVTVEMEDGAKSNSVSFTFLELR